MFSWFRRPDRPPSPAAENPGRGHTVRVAFANAKRSWKEEDDLAVSLATTLNALGHKATVKGDWVALDDGLSLVPQVVNVTPMDDSGVRTVTTIQTSHAVLIPRGVFEFQHASGADVREAFAQGFKGWAELDLPVFLDALRANAATCMTMTMEPERRLVLGPPVQMAQKTDPVPDEHGFCPCCLFTSSVKAFEDLLKDDAFYGIRLFVTRDAEGRIEADCRVNGIDRPAGAAVLARYAQGWVDRGVEYRKQYVCIQKRVAGS